MRQPLRWCLINQVPPGRLYSCADKVDGCKVSPSAYYWFSVSRDFGAETQETQDTLQNTRVCYFTMFYTSSARCQRHCLDVYVETRTVVNLSLSTIVYFSINGERLNFGDVIFLMFWDMKNTLQSIFKMYLPFNYVFEIHYDLLNLIRPFNL